MPNGFGIQVRNLGPLAAAWSRSLQQRLYDAPDATIDGVNPSNWPSAMQPVRPFGQPGAQPLAIRVAQAMNMLFQPRPDAEYTAGDLKRLVRTAPLARLCIDNTKDVIGDVRWHIQPKLKPGEKQADRNKRSIGDPILLALTKFFEYPDRGNRYNWTEWTRQLIDEMLTIDAGTILVRRNKKKLIADLPVIPGDTICRYVDDNGFTPAPPSPAYAQLWEGIPRINLTTDQLIYKPRNIVWGGTVSSQLYGCSPTEAIAPELEVGALRLKFTKAFYETGNLPSAIQVIPIGTDPAKVAEAFKVLDGALSGNLEARRGIRHIQGFAENEKDQILFPTEPLLFGPYDDMYTHRVCFAYGVSPQRLQRMMNRATAEQSQEAAEAEGLLPWLTWLKGIVNFIIQVLMGYDDYEFVWEMEQEQDIVKRMTADTGYAPKIYTINEVREKNGDDPSSEPNADKLGVFGPNGFIPIDSPPVAPGAHSEGEPEPGQPGQPVPRGARKPPQRVEDGGTGGQKVLKLVVQRAWTY